LHNRILRNLKLAHVQLDELRLKVQGVAAAAWLWVAGDARTKLIPAFALGSRTQAVAHQLVHPTSLRFGDYSEVAPRLAPSCLPVFSSDGLALYFYALTAHFGEWVQTLGERRRVWMVAARLHAKRAQVIKHYRRRRVTAVRYHVHLGTPEAYRQARCALGFSGRIPTAFIERRNLTIRRSIAGLARRSWSAAHSLSELAWQFEWWRAVYHITRPHSSLRQAIGEQPLRPRYQSRTPAQAAGLTNHRWTVQELLACPALSLKVK